MITENVKGIIDVVNKAGADDDAQELFKCIISQLSAYGITVTGYPDYMMAINELSNFLIAKAYGLIDGRHCITLPAGFGKSTALKCLIRILFLKGMKSRSFEHPIAINIERVEDVEAFYKDLVDNYDVDEDYVARIHSDLTDHDVQLQANSLIQYYGFLKRKPFIIITHARLAVPQFEKDYYEYEDFTTGKGRTRALFWDEEIQPAITSTIEVKALLGEIDKYIPKIQDEINDAGGNVQKEKMLVRLGKLFANIRPDLRKHRDTSGVIHITGNELSGIKPSQINWLTIDRDPVPDNLKTFLLTLLDNNATQNGEVILKNLGVAHVLTHRQVLSDTVTNLTVLDASVPLRKLSQIDNSFKIADISASIDYSDVNIHIHQYASGKSSINPAFKGKQQNPYVGFIREHIDPKGKTLIICHKDVEDEILKLFKGPNVEVAHYGAINGRNDWSDYDRCILLGQFREPESSYRCKVASRLKDNDFNHSDLDSLTREVNRTDFVHHAYQGLNRVRCRRIVGSDVNSDSCTAKAMKADIYMFDKDPDMVAELLKIQMPNANVQVHRKGSTGLSEAFKDANEAKGDGKRKGPYDDDINDLLIPKMKPETLYSRKELIDLIKTEEKAESIIRALVGSIHKFPAIKKSGRGSGTKYFIEPGIKF
ncbi:hypothetical protein [Desulfogranum marinum]|uniref:hypothetical protein n=1 Tax=Desulfogranum marinum TaxID=453220 RepID=UPI00196255B5|nr:hypothetical protein [Desulfogranum marinum]MBM9515223.1 hypothetical protein [Desulfogranum marinum]